MPSFFDRLKRLWRRPAANGHLPQLVVQAMAASLQGTEEVEYTCEEVYHLLDQCAEAALRGADISALMPLVYRHLEKCPDCREEYEALLRILRTSPAEADHR